MDKVCGYEKCDGKAIGKLCSAHYWQKSRGMELRPIKRRAANGQGTTNSEGYRRVYKPGHPNANAHGTILEHRWVMSEHLGRPLLPEENVHHKNGSRCDNRLENLELWNSSQPPGQRPDELLEWARHIIELYG